VTDWLLDLGNTRLKVAALAAGEDRPGPVHAFAHAELPDALGTLDGLASGDRAWLASVAAGALAQDLEDLLVAAGLRVERVATQAAQGALRVAYPRPERLGVDRFLALLGASSRNDGPWVIASAGSALTVDVLGADGVHLGGVIAPTAAHMQAMLGLRFPALDAAMRAADAIGAIGATSPRSADRRAPDHGAEADPASRPPTLGLDTVDGIVAGTRHAELGLVERVLAEARARLGEEPLLLLTGGDADALRAVDAPRQLVAPTLVLDGLAHYVRARTP
jgi:type III pantothenate kinase